MAFLMITESLREEDMTFFYNTLWCLWKGRNEEIFQGIKSTPQTILTKAKLMEPPIRREAGERQTTGRAANPTVIPTGTEILLMDASWAIGGTAGWGAILYDETGQLKEVGFDFLMISDPFHAEAMVLLHILLQGQELVQRGVRRNVILFSDCQMLVNAVRNMDINLIPSWEAAHTVARCIQIAQELKETVTIRHIARQALTGPHKLANWARVHKLRGTDTSLHTITARLQIPQNVETCYFTVESQH